ncbi:MAG: IS110 family transposase [Actinomycetota bacterium]|jgi:transposase|nr:IS110 family transposase [Actinomycetota bacterium]
MKEMLDKVGGLDVHRDTVVACTRVRDPDGEVVITKETFVTTRKGLEGLAQFLTEAEVSTVVMEATGVYWKPVYYALEGLFSQLWLCNAQHVKNVPGRKTDLADAEWLADVAAHGMVRPSFVPPPEIRELRELTRYRKTQVDARAREIQRLEKVLQDAGIKLTSVASSVWSASSRQIIEAMIAGQRDPAVLAQMAKSSMRRKIPQLEEALYGHFGAHHAFVTRQIIDHIDYLDSAIAALTQEICERLLPFEAAVALVSSIPGISAITAQVIIAETGGDMSRFPTPAHLCAWAGVAPASYESAGKRRSVGARHGSPWLKRTMVEAARAAARSKGTYSSAQYSRIARRRGPNRATMAVANSMLGVVWHLLTTGELYQDPGANYFETHNDPSAQAKRLSKRIEALGFCVTITEKVA